MKRRQRTDVNLFLDEFDQGEIVKKQIISVSPVQTAKLFAALYFLVSLPVVGLTAIMFLFSPYPTPGIGFLVLFQLLYLVFGFIVTATGARIYNIAAKWVGGIEYISISLENNQPLVPQQHPQAPRHAEAGDVA